MSSSAASQESQESQEDQEDQGAEVYESDSSVSSASSALLRRLELPPERSNHGGRSDCEYIDAPQPRHTKRTSFIEHLINQATRSTLNQLRSYFRTCTLINTRENIKLMVNVLSGGSLRLCIQSSTQPARIQSVYAENYHKVNTLECFMSPTTVWIYFPLNHLLVFTDYATICSSTLFSAIYDRSRFPCMRRATMMFMHNRVGPEVIFCNLDANSVSMYTHESESPRGGTAQARINRIVECPTNTNEWWVTDHRDITYGELLALEPPK